MNKFFCFSGFSLTYNIILILGGTDSVLHSSIKKDFVHSVESDISEKVLQ